MIQLSDDMLNQIKQDQFGDEVKESVACCSVPVVWGLVTGLQAGANALGFSILNPIYAPLTVTLQQAVNSGAIGGAIYFPIRLCITIPCCTTQRERSYIENENPGPCSKIIWNAQVVNYKIACGLTPSLGALCSNTLSGAVNSGIASAIGAGVQGLAFTPNAIATSVAIGATGGVIFSCGFAAVAGGFKLCKDGNVYCCNDGKVYEYNFPEIKCCFKMPSIAQAPTAQAEMERDNPPPMAQEVLVAEEVPAATPLTFAYDQEQKAPSAPSAPSAPQVEKVDKIEYPSMALSNS